MRLDFLRGETSHLRKGSALGIIAAFLFAFALSDAPRLHEHLHKALGADHECVVTILLSGMYDHSACVPPSTIPPLDPSTSVVGPQQFPSIEAGLEFSLLEHAPPLFA